MEQRKIKPLKQKTKDRLVVIGLLALETGLIYNVGSSLLTSTAK